MFTGIVEEVGTVASIGGGTIKVNCDLVLSDVLLGDSISTNGVCLTVTAFGEHWFTADIMPETVSRSTFSNVSIGSKVNLERAMVADGRFGGHMVSGHIDGVGRIESLIPDGNAIWVTVTAPDDVLKYVIMKGSIAIDGISLTVAHVDEDSFKVSVIPMTGSETTLLSKASGDSVNLECDIYGKYVERFMTFQPKKKDISMDFLRSNGFL